LKPSYNVAQILDPFVGVNHPRAGKTVSQEVRNKISTTLSGRVLTTVHKVNISLAQKRQAIYCYNYHSGNFVTSFVSIRFVCTLWCAHKSFGLGTSRARTYNRT
jgi:hypothetical protein